jgi:hypothetical protein
MLDPAVRLLALLGVIAGLLEPLERFLRLLLAVECDAHEQLRVAGVLESALVDTVLQGVLRGRPFLRCMSTSASRTYRSPFGCSSAVSASGCAALSYSRAAIQQLASVS